MAKTSKLSAGTSRVISKGTTDKVKLCEKKLSDGRIRLYLQIYNGSSKEVNPDTGAVTYKPIRHKETLPLYLYDNARTVDEREHNKNTRAIADQKRYEREQELLRDDGFSVQKKREIDFLQFFREYIENYPKKDIRVMKAAYNRFVLFLNDTPKYRIFAKGFQPKLLDKDMMLSFVTYLQLQTKGESAHSLFARFRKFVAYAIEHDVIIKDPCKGISIKVDNGIVKKEVLSPAEIETLKSVQFPHPNTDIRQAFLFSYYTGLRFSDVYPLIFRNIDYINKTYSIKQAKTGKSINNPLSDKAMDLIARGGEKDQRVFNLPPYQTCLKALQKWVDTAGIGKHITWHCSRHSFGTNSILNGGDIEDVRELMGHSSIAMTAKYLHAANEQKRKIVNNL